MKKIKNIKYLIINCFRNRKRKNLKYVVNLSDDIPNYSNMSENERGKVLIGSTASEKAKKYFEEKEKFDAREINNYQIFKRTQPIRKDEENEVKG